MLKSELEAEVERLKGELEKSSDRRYAAKAAAEEHGESISALKHRLLDREREISRLRGYMDRVKEEEVIRLAPKSEFEAWQRDRIPGRVTVSGGFDPDPWGHSKPDSPDGWMDL